MSFTLHGRVGRGSKVENGRKNSRFRLSVFLYLSCILKYTETGRESLKTGRETGRVYPGAGRETREGVSRPYLWGPVFRPGYSIFILFLINTE